MNQAIELLRERARRSGGDALLEEVADEIETLRAENVELRAQQIKYIGKSAKQQDEIERLNEIMADARCDHCGSSHIRGIKPPNAGGQATAACGGSPGTKC